MHRAPRHGLERPLLSHDHANRLPKAAVALLLAVGLLVLLQVGMLISKAAADIGGGTSATTVTPDAISDEVAATAAEFRVDESGAATYSIPLYAVPGAAGVSPKLSLQYPAREGTGASARAGRSADCRRSPAAARRASPATSSSTAFRQMAIRRPSTSAQATVIA